MSQTHREVAERLIETLGYDDDERVRAVFVVGSSAIGTEDKYSDVDVMIVVDELISDEERLETLRSIGAHNIMLVIAGLDNPALPVKSQVIDKFVFDDTWFDVSYHLPHQLQFCFDYLPLIDKDGYAAQVCPVAHDYTEAELKERVQANLRLLHVRIYRYKKYCWRGEWIGLDLSAIKNAVVDILMVLNDRPGYNRYSSRITDLLHELAVKPDGVEEDLEDILRMDDRTSWEEKVEWMDQLEADLTQLAEDRWGPIRLYDDVD